jgi:hypothetical protein
MLAATLFCLASALAAGCRPAAPLYVSGLTLPPGAVEVKRSESKREATGGKGPTRSLHVTFDSDQSWDEVVAHFDRQLARAVFAETSSTFLQKHPKMDSAITRDVLSRMRHYQRPGRQGMVSLTDETDKLAATEQADGTAASTKSGRYEVWIYGL